MYICLSFLIVCLFILVVDSCIFVPHKLQEFFCPCLTPPIVSTNRLLTRFSIKSISSVPFIPTTRQSIAVRQLLDSRLCVGADLANEPAVRTNFAILATRQFCLFCYTVSLRHPSSGRDEESGAVSRKIPLRNYQPIPHAHSLVRRIGWSRGFGKFLLPVAGQPTPARRTGIAVPRLRAARFEWPSSAA